MKKNLFLISIIFSCFLQNIYADEVQVRLKTMEKQGGMFLCNRDLPFLQTSSEQGYTVAQFLLARCYYEKGDYIASKEAAKLFQKAALERHAGAAFYLGLMHQKGEALFIASHREAVKWYFKAAKQGYTEALFTLGTIYDSSYYSLKYHINSKDKVTKDNKQAVTWYRQAAEQGNDEGLYNLASMYYEGKGIMQNSQEAIKGYRKAEAQNGYAIFDVRYRFRCDV